MLEGWLKIKGSDKDLKVFFDEEPGDDLPPFVKFLKLPDDQAGNKLEKILVVNRDIIRTLEYTR